MSNSLRHRRLPLRLALLTLMASLLVATVVTVGGVGYLNLTKSIQEMFESRFSDVARDTSDRVHALLEPATSILSECQTQAQRGLLPMNDSDALGERLAERLRFQEGLTWLSYGDSEGRFTGAHRLPDGHIVINRSWPSTSGGRMIEQIIHPDGTREEVQSKDNWTYDPRERGWYQLGSSSPSTAWTEPYEFWNNEGIGITCVVADRDEAGKVRGVFTADYHLHRISEFLSGLKIGKSGRAFVLTRSGKVIAAPLSEGRTPDAGLLVEAQNAMPQGFETLVAGQPALFRFEHQGVKYAAAFEPFDVSKGVQWVVAVVVPERELLGNVYRNATYTGLIGLVSLIIALLLGNWFCRRLAQPLQKIATDLANVGRFELSENPPPDTQIHEIAVVGDAVERMKASLRSFGRYVPTGLVREMLARGEEAQLGGRLEVVTIHFSDIDGFSRISEKLPTNEILTCLSDYFELMADSVTRHQGTLDKFIGDGMLALFNAPTTVADHAAKACKAALEAQAKLAEIRERSTEAIRPNFNARIGLHTAEVLVGNIGTPSRIAYTVLGDGVNLASGIEALNKVYGTQILVTQETRDAAGNGFEWRRIDLVSVKGRAKGGNIFELLGESNSVPDKILRARDAYEKAMEQYQERRWAQAIAFFQDSLFHRPSDRASRTMLVRAREFTESPPPAEWDRTYVHASS